MVVLPSPQCDEHQLIERRDGGLMLDERREVSYPDATQAPDGTIYASWDRNRAPDGEVLLGRFREENILAQRLVTPNARLGVLIRRSRPA